MQHLQHNFKVNYWFNIKLWEDIRISKWIYKKLTYKQSFLLNVQPRFLKSSKSQCYIIKFNFEWILLHLQLNKFPELQKNLFGL